MSKIYQLSNLQIIELPYHVDGANGQLIVMEGLSIIPFDIARVFTVTAPKNAIRGEHAHLKCTQLLTCVSGSIEVICDDGFVENKILLSNPKLALIIPPMIWARQIYLQNNSILTVLCDRKYEKEDYIRDYYSFKKIKSIDK